MEFYVRSEGKSQEQLGQIGKTYEVARMLRAQGIDCEVREFFTGKDTKADAAAIVLSMPPSAG